MLKPSAQPILDTEDGGKWATFTDYQKRCAICNNWILDTSNPDLCCWGHEEDCPNFANPDAGLECDCDVNYHVYCCPVCNGPEEESEEE